MRTDLMLASKTLVNDIEENSAAQIVIEFKESEPLEEHKRGQILTELLEANGYTVKRGQQNKSTPFHRLIVGRPIRSDIIALFESEANNFEMNATIHR
jgi:hypothetical protein